MRFRPSALVILGVAFGLGGCLKAPPPLGPSPIPYIGCVTPIKVAIPCTLGNWACPNDTVVHNSTQLQSALTSCGIACQAPSNPCNFNTQMMIGLSLETGCALSTSLSSICYFADHVEVTIFSASPPKGAPMCNMVPIPYVEWVVVPASKLPVIFESVAVPESDLPPI